MTALGGFSITGLGFDDATGRLYGTSATGLWEIDPTTAAATQVGPLDGDDYDALAGGALPGAVNAVRPSALELLSLDLTTAASSSVGPCSGVEVESSGSAHVFELGANPVSYCTAGTSASGCQATLASTGVPSATAVSGFELLSDSVEGSKDGLFFFGTSGRQANPWGSGSSFQCVVPPVARAGLLSGQGSAGLCDGAFVQDLNARWCPSCPKPQQNPGAGSVVQAQLWYRDPGNTSNQTTSLSAALEFTVQP